MLKFFRSLFGGRAADPGKEAVSLQTAVAGRTRAEADLRASERHFAGLVSSVRDYAVFLLDAEGRVLTWNAGAERIKGYRAEEIVGRHFSQFYPGEAVSTGWPAHELRVASETGRFEDEGWRLRRDGSKFWASVVITTLRDEAGRVQGFLKITRDLTDRKQAEEKLRLSDERFRLLMDGVRDYAIFMLDPQGRIATWNVGAERLKGYTAAEAIGLHFSRFYTAEALARDWPTEELRRATVDGRFEDEGWRVRKDGSTFWANVVISALRDEAGALRGFAKVTRDLTERRKSEENARRLVEEEAARRAEEAGRKAAEIAAQEIERQREQLHTTLASIGDAVVVTDRHGVVTFLNAVAAGLTGWELGDAVGQPLERVFRIINEDTRAAVENPVEKVFRENRIVELANHTALVAKDGREVPIEDTAAPIRSRTGAIDGAVLVFRDVTEWRRAVESRLHLAAIVESSDDAIIGQTLDERISSWNRGAERLYGYTDKEAIGQPVSLLVPPDHIDELPILIGRIKRGEAIEHFETERVCKGGRRVHVSLTISPVRNAEGRITGASKIARDITARKEEDRRKNEFLALLAHELRNPLAPLRNGLEILRLLGGDEAAQATRGVMERQLQHLVRLVDDLLDVSRISRGQLQLQKRRVELAEVLRDAIDISSQTIRDQGHELTTTLPDAPVYLDADKTRLTQAFCNLLNNAAKYSERGGRIAVNVERPGGEVVIRVKDRGVGIPQDMLPHVFEMFMQVDRSLEKTQGGLGVGLTIVKQLVEMHGGRVEAHSEGEGRGSEFVVRLPIPASGDALASPQLESHATVVSPCRVLVVDDNKDAAESLATLLKMMGNEVTVAYDGQAGLDAAGEFRPDVVLLDIGMPQLNGYDAARRIREQPWGRSMILAALTGWGQESDRQKSAAAGFDAHLVKPVEPAAVAKLLETLVARTNPT